MSMPSNWAELQEFPVQPALFFFVSISSIFGILYFETELFLSNNIYISNKWLLSNGLIFKYFFSFVPLI